MVRPYSFSAFFLMILVLRIAENSGTDLCSTCECGHRTDSEQKLPVTWADCRRNNLEDFPASQVSINLLDLSHNNFGKLAKTKKNILDTGAILELKVCYNAIFNIDIGFFDDFSQLQELDLSHNNITDLGSPDLFRNLKNLRYLNLSYNFLKTLPEHLLSPLTQIRYLDLSYNDFLGQWLVKAANTLGNTLGLNKSVISLKLDHVGLHELHSSYFDNYTKLQYLSLADNQFKDVPNVPYSVQYLDLSGTDLSVLQGKHLNYHSLKVLKLNRLKRLSEIHKYAFYNLQALEELSIKLCPNLDEFNENIFGVLTKETVLPLRKLDLSGNKLKTLNSTYRFLFDQLKFVDLTQNPWKCDCDILWLQEFKNFLYNDQEIRCSSPKDLRNKILSELDEDDTPNCFPEKYGRKSHRIMLVVLIVLIIVLSTLIGYLIMYAPTWKGGSRGIGPQSPYSPTRLQEEE